MSRGAHSRELARTHVDRTGQAIELAGLLGGCGAAIVSTILVRQLPHWPRPLTGIYLISLTAWAWGCGVLWLYGLARAEDARARRVTVDGGQR